MTEPTISIQVPGIPQPAGSKKAFPIKRANGKMGASVADANDKSRDWKRQVAVFAGEQYEGEPLDGPLALRVVFYLPRPKSHYGSGRNADKLLPSAPEYHTQKPDATKLLRAVEDALSGVVWRDDVQIVEQIARKRWVTGRPGASIEIVDVRSNGDG